MKKSSLVLCALILFLALPFLVALGQDGGQAIRLDNTDYTVGGEFVYFPYHDYGISDELTVALWIRWESDPANTISNPHEPTQNKWSNIVTMDYHDDIDQGQFWLQHNAGNTKFEWAVQSTSTTKSVLSSTVPQSGVWYYLVGVYDGSPDQGTTSMRLYVNGEQESSAGTPQISGSIIAHDGHMRLNLGRIPSDYRLFNGVIDEVRIWKRALTREEIRKQMHSPSTVNPEGLLSYYDMNSTWGTMVSDSTGTLDGTFYTALVDVHSIGSNPCASIPFTNYTSTSPWKIADGDKDWSSYNFSGMPTLTVSGTGISQSNVVASNTCNTLTMTYGWSGSGSDTITVPVVDGQPLDTWLGIEDAAQTSQWQTSAAPVAQEYAYVVTASPASVGASGCDLQVTITSVPDSSSNVLAYSYGNAADPPVTGESYPSGITGRSAVIWGASMFGSATATLVFDYSGMSGISQPSGMTLLRRAYSSSAWEEVPASGLTHDTASRRFTLTGVTDVYEYSIGADLGVNPLPVELTSFSAYRSGAAVTLSWETATELHSYAFVVECRHPSLSMWTELATVSAAGMSSTPRRYRWRHGDAPIGDLQYRLRMLDRDGSMEYSPAVTVSKGTTAGDITMNVFPQPASGNVRLRLRTREANDVQIRLFDLLGRELQVLHRGAVRGEILLSFDVSALTAGIYVVAAETPRHRRTMILRVMQ